MNTKRRMKLSSQGTIFLAVFLLLFGMVLMVQASPPEVGLVTKLSGEVTYWNDDDQKEPARVKAFMKIRQGDQIKLSANSVVQLLYCSNGRQETWEGPATFSVGSLESQALDERKPLPQPEVKMLPSRVTQRIVDAPIPLPRSRICVAGSIPFLGLPKKEPPAAPAITPVLTEEAKIKIKAAKEHYKSLRKQINIDDVTAELYLLSVLANYEQYQDMEQVIDTMLEKRPGDNTLKELRAWARSQSLKRGQSTPSLMK
jgi:hypothetical protein